MVEGAPLLRAYMVKNRIEGSNPSLSASKSEPFLVKGFFFWRAPRRAGFPAYRHSPFDDRGHISSGLARFNRAFSVGLFAGLTLPTHGWVEVPVCDQIFAVQ